MSRWKAGINFVLFYMRELFVSTIRISVDVLTPGLKINPCLHEISTSKYSPLTTLLLSNLISFTPGTVVVRFEDDRQLLTIHFLYFRDIPAFHERFLAKFDRAFVVEGASE